MLRFAAILSLFGAARVFAQPKNPAGAAAACFAGLTDAQKDEIGNKIWGLEGAHRILIWWDATGGAPSFGINNYLWYPAGRTDKVHETFPELMEYLAARGVSVPDWMRGHPAPWTSEKELFQAAVPPANRRKGVAKRAGIPEDNLAIVDSPEAAQLRELLASTIELQEHFSIERGVKSLDAILHEMSGPERADKRQAISEQFARVACAPGGAFAIVDYVNFKGEGIEDGERYEDSAKVRQGWGLWQVLEHMKGSEPGPAAIDEFIDSAKWALQRRVQLAPDDKRENEAGWLKNWYGRLENYRS